MKIKQLLLAGILSIGVMGMNVAPAHAAGFGSELQIEVKATTVDVTVPGTAAFVFNEDGSNTTPSNFEITNNSITPVSLDSVEFDGESSGWKFLSSGTDLKTKPVDTKSIKMKLGLSGDLKEVAPTNGSEDETATATFGSGVFDIESKGTKKVDFEVERTAFTSAEGNAKAFGMTFNFSFN